MSLSKVNSLCGPRVLSELGCCSQLHGSAKAPQNRIVMPKRNSIADVTYGHVGTRKYENLKNPLGSF